MFFKLQACSLMVQLVENTLIKLSTCLVIRYHGQIGASLILGGVDCTGNHLYTVGPYGSVNKMPFLAMGMCYYAIFPQKHIYIYSLTDE